VRNPNALPLAYQKWKSEENQGRIIAALHEGDKTFTELLKATGVSNPVLTDHLKALEKKGKVKVVPNSKTKSFFYSLNKKHLSEGDLAFIRLSRKKAAIVAELEKAASDKGFPDEEYKKLFEERLKELAVHQLTLAYKISPEYGRETVEATYGREFSSKLEHILPTKRKEALVKIIEAVKPEGARLIKEL
jgi:DNA-binding HxlR family transcriptional regulator